MSSRTSLSATIWRVASGDRPRSRRDRFGVTFEVVDTGVIGVIVLIADTADIVGVGFFTRARCEDILARFDVRAAILLVQKHQI